MLVYNDEEEKALRQCLEVLQNRRQEAEASRDVLVLCIIDFLEDVIKRQ